MELDLRLATVSSALRLLLDNYPGEFNALVDLLPLDAFAQQFGSLAGLACKDIVSSLSLRDDSSSSSSSTAVQPACGPLLPPRTQSRPLDALSLPRLAIPSTAASEDPLAAYTISISEADFAADEASQHRYLVVQCPRCPWQPRLVMYEGAIPPLLRLYDTAGWVSRVLACTAPRMACNNFPWEVFALIKCIEYGEAQDRAGGGFLPHHVGIGKYAFWATTEAGRVAVFGSDAVRWDRCVFGVPVFGHDFLFGGRCRLAEVRLDLLLDWGYVNGVFLAPRTNNGDVVVVVSIWERYGMDLCRRFRSVPSA